jgi:hypothetical protein
VPASSSAAGSRGELPNCLVTAASENAVVMVYQTLEQQIETQITPATFRCGHNFHIPKCPFAERTE